MKTLEEFAIKEIQDLREENKLLKAEISADNKIILEVADERKFWENKYRELVKKLKEDFEPRISYLREEKYFEFGTSFIKENNLQKDEYYFNLFDLKNEKENKDE